MFSDFASEETGDDGVFCELTSLQSIGNVETRERAYGFMVGTWWGSIPILLSGVVVQRENWREKERERGGAVLDNKEKPKRRVLVSKPDQKAS